MMPDLSNEQVIQKAERVKRLLADEDFCEVCLAVEEQLVRQWKGAEDAAERDDCWHRLRGLRSVLEQLQSAIVDGEITQERVDAQAARELARKAGRVL